MNKSKFNAASARSRSGSSKRDNSVESQESESTNALRKSLKKKFPEIVEEDIEQSDALCNVTDEDE